METTEEVLALCRRLAEDVVGGEIECSWVAWLCKDDTWWDGAPIIIQVSGVNYEICWSKEADCAITRNTINVHESVRWIDCEELTLFWKKDGLAALQNIVGQRVNKIQLIEAEVTISNHSDHPPGWSTSYWVSYGINFILTDGFLSIYNAFDTNGVTDNINDYPSPYSFGTSRVADRIAANEDFRLISL